MISDYSEYIPLWQEYVLAKSVMKGKEKEREKALSCLRSLLQGLLENKFGHLSEYEIMHINTVSDYNTLQKMCVTVPVSPTVSAVFAAGV